MVEFILYNEKSTPSVSVKLISAVHNKMKVVIAAVVVIAVVVIAVVVASKGNPKEAYIKYPDNYGKYGNYGKILGNEGNNLKKILDELKENFF